MACSMLKVDVPSDRLKEMYGVEQYYWYLHSQPFRKMFLKPLGHIINRLGLSCLDVGCGAGWLADYLTVPYVGIDGSVTAIEQARAQYPARAFYLARIENPVIPCGSFGTLVFGNIFWVHIRQESQAEFLELYRRFDPCYFVIYDLQRLDTSAIDARYERVEKHAASVELDGIPDIKKHRKILVYRCN